MIKYFKEFLCQGGAEKYSEAVKLHDVLSQNDPETEPFASKYKARAIWQDLVAELESVPVQSATEQELERKILIGALEFRLGLSYNETEELANGETHLKKCLSLIECERMDERACSAVQLAYNQLGILWTFRRKMDKALTYFQHSETLYQTFRKDVGNAPLTMDELFSDKEESLEERLEDRKSKFEDAYTHALYYLGQVYMQIQEGNSAAKYFHMTLSRQLECGKYDPVDWAINCATLSQFYSGRSSPEYLPLARHCLASGECILMQAGEPALSANILPDDTQDQVDVKEKRPKAWADLYRYWAQYGVSILERSMKDMVERETLGNNTSAGSSAIDEEERPAERCLLFNLELTSYEDRIPCRFVKTFEEARPIFLLVQSWLNKAKEFYKLDGFCSDYIAIVQGCSNAYKILAFFEMSIDRQCKMHKRRIDMLTELLSALNPKFYLLVCRQLIYELAEGYMTLMDLKIQSVEEGGEQANMHQAKKINALATDAIKKYQEYLDSFKDAEQKPPEKYFENERPVLVAYFCMGRLYTKLLRQSPEEDIKNVKATLRCYQFLVDYCKKNEAAAKKMTGELPVCQEMVSLLPKKLEKMTIEATESL